MKLPKHIELHLTHNEHASSYLPLEKYIAQDHLADYYADDEWVSPEQKAKAVATNSVWTMHWYPDTPIGFVVLHAADLNVLLAKADK